MKGLILVVVKVRERGRVSGYFVANGWRWEEEEEMQKE